MRLPFELGPFPWFVEGVAMRSQVPCNVLDAVANDIVGSPSIAASGEPMTAQPIVSSFVPFFLLAVAAFLNPTERSLEESARHVAKSVEVTILSSNLADGATVGEWGFAALVKADDHCLLFDTGRYPDTVIRNAEVLNVDLTCVSDIVLSHFHSDHTSGLVPLASKLKEAGTLQRVHVAAGIFLPRRRVGGNAEQAMASKINQMSAVRVSLIEMGIEVLEYDAAAEVQPGVWLTGPVERKHDERNFPLSIEVEIDGEWKVDFVPESQGLTIVSENGPVVLLGCGHSGAVNLLEQVRERNSNQRIHALMGGMHLFNADEETLGWTADRLRQIGLDHLMAGHCTGIEPLMRLRTGLGLNRSSAVVGAVGSRFVVGEGIHPTAIAQ